MTMLCIGFPSSCFLQNGAYLYYGFLLEVLLMVIFNIIVFVLIVRRVVFRPILSSNAQKNKKKEMIARMQQFVLFFFLLGISWIFGFLAMIPNRRTYAFEVLFCVFASIQGLVLFMFITVKNPDVRKAFKKAKVVFHQTGMYEVSRVSGNSQSSSEIATTRV